MKSELHLGQSTYPIHALNRKREDNQAVIYTWDFHRNTLTSPGGVELAFDKEGKFLAAASFNSATAENGFVYSVGSNFSIPFEEPQHAKLSFDVDPLLDLEQKKNWNFFDNILGGTPVLVFAGKEITDFSSERTLEKFLKEQFPRTAVGIKKFGTLIFLLA